MRKPSQDGFTLIELLAAVGVMAVLMALATAGIFHLRASAISASCLSNLRQIGVALQLYLDDHGEQFPTLAAARESVEEELPALETALLPYAGAAEVFYCPGDNGGIGAATGTSYYWNSALNGQRLGQLVFFTLSDPGRIPVVADKERFHDRTAHPVNYLYADGHSRQNLRLFTE